VFSAGIAWPNMEDKETTCFILEAWQPAPAVYNKKNREINVYTNAASVKLELNGKPLGSVVDVPFFGQATFNVTYAPGAQKRRRFFALPVLHGNNEHISKTESGQM